MAIAAERATGSGQDDETVAAGFALEVDEPDEPELVEPELEELADVLPESLPDDAGVLVPALSVEPLLSPDALPSVGAERESVR